MGRHAFEAMGTTVECILESDGPRSAAALAESEAEIRRLERIFTRFRDTSELSRLNRAGALAVGPELLEVTELALAARERTGGRFDPTLHDAVVAAGYDRTFAEVEADGPENGFPPPSGGGRVTVDRAGSRIELGDGVKLDLGGIVKGWAVDRACDLLAPEGPCLVNAGGDLAVRGRPAADVWAIEVETTNGGALTLGLDSGALATSGIDRRRWRRGGEERHHIIDPTSGRPATSDLLRITVAAETAVDAEVLSTSFFLAGARRAAEEADELRSPCVLVRLDGQVLTAGGLA